MVDESGARFLRSGEFVVDRRARELHRGEDRVAIQNKPLCVLEALLVAGNDVVTRSELAAVLWPGVDYVDSENGINTAVRKLRDALGDAADAPRFVETVPRVGYRWLGAVEESSLATVCREVTQTPQGVEFPVRQLAAGWRGAVAVAAVVAVMGLVLALAYGGDEASPTLPESQEARDAWREARFLLEGPALGSLPAQVDRLAEATRLLERVVSYDPGFGPAHGHLAQTLVFRLFSRRECEDCESRVREAVARTLALDPEQLEANLAAAQIALVLDWDAATASKHIDLAQSVAPESGEAWLVRASWLAAVGRSPEAVVAVERAIDSDPGSNLIRGDLGFFLLAADRPQEARVVCERLGELEPSFQPGLRCRLLAHLALDQDSEAERVAAQLLSSLAGASVESEDEHLAPPTAQQVPALELYLERNLARAESSGRALSIAGALALMERRDEALDALEEAVANRELMLAMLPLFAEFRTLRYEPRFLRLMDQIGIVETAPPGKGKRSAVDQKHVASWHSLRPRRHRAILYPWPAASPSSSWTGIESERLLQM